MPGKEGRREREIEWTCVVACWLQLISQSMSCCVGVYERFCHIFMHTAWEEKGKGRDKCDVMSCHPTSGCDCTARPDGSRKQDYTVHDDDDLQSQAVVVVVAVCDSSCAVLPLKSRDHAPRVAE